MNVKQFIDWRKILIFAILILATSAIRNLFINGADIGANYGFPFNFYGYGGGPPLMQGQPIPYYFSYVALILDIVVWYFFSFLTVFAYDKLRRKK